MKLTRRRPARRSFALLVPLVLACTLLGASSALAITRAATLSRAQEWVNHPVAYSQSKYHLGYRTDCSGYVSACWGTGISWSTSTFHAVTHPIAKSDLKPGDAMLKKGYHIRLFHNWVDSSHTRYVAYEAGTKVAVARVHSLATDLKAGYIPTRYNGILDGPAPNNVIWNGAFDAWLQTGWDAESEEPISWQVTGARDETLFLHRTDVFRTAASSIELLNPGDDPNAYTELSQTASVTAGGIYRLSGWARMVSDPSTLRLGVAYLDAAGATIAETSTTGDAWGVGPGAFTQMSAMTTAPAGAINAVVTARLAGGTTTDPYGDVPGTAAILDDIGLTRPQATISVKANATTTRVGKTVSFSGSITPTTCVGVRAVVYVKRPKQGWKRLAYAPVTASGGSAMWRGSFAFKRGMRKGVYQFRTTVPNFGGYIGATTKVVSVRLK
jgi:hypothetical protein